MTGYCKRMKSLRAGEIVAGQWTEWWRITRVRRDTATRTVQVDAVNLFDRAERHMAGGFDDWRDLRRT